MRVLAVVLAGSVSACSLFQIPAPTYSEPITPCSRNTMPVKIDLAVGTASVIAGLATLLFIEPRKMDEGRNIPGTVIAGSLVVTGIGFLVAAKIGSNRVSECRELRSTDRRYGEPDED